MTFKIEDGEKIRYKFMLVGYSTDFSIVDLKADSNLICFHILIQFIFTFKKEDFHITFLLILFSLHYIILSAFHLFATLAYNLFMFNI